MGTRLALGEAKGEHRLELLKQLATAVDAQGQRGPSLHTMIQQLADAYELRPGFVTEQMALILETVKED